MKYKPNQLINRILVRDYDIELSDFEHYVQPEKDSRILSVSKRIAIGKGENFDIKNFFKPFLKISKTLKISDGYLFNKNRGWKNLNTILSICPGDMKVTILTLTDRARRNKDEDDGIIAEEKLNELQEKYNLRFNFILVDSKKELHDRCIETDQFYIDIGRGLDFVYTQPLTEEKQSDETMLTVTAKNNVRN